MIRESVLTEREGSESIESATPGDADNWLTVGVGDWLTQWDAMYYIIIWSTECNGDFAGES